MGPLFLAIALGSQIGYFHKLHGRLTQWLECHPHTVEVTGSNPVPPTMMNITPRYEGFFYFSQETVKMINPRILSAGVVVLRREEGEWLFLILRAFRYWDFPKGIVEHGEDPIDAAKREVKEETTITELDFKWGYDFIETGPYNRGKIARYYLAETTQKKVELPINPEIGKPEHHEYRWVTYEQALKLVGERVRPVVKWAWEKVSKRDENF